MHAISVPAAANLSTVPAPVLVVLGVLVVVVIGLDIVALFDLYRRPSERVVLQNKWIWLAIIVLVNLFGAIVYLAVGRKPGFSDDTMASHSPSARTKDIVDSLYGRGDGTDQT